MKNFPTLSKAPAVEAVIELRVRLPDSSNESVRQSFISSLRADFPRTQDIRFISAKVEFGVGAATQEVADSVVGVRLDSADSKWVVQAKSDGIALSRLAPYESWSSLLEKFRAVWGKYVEHFRPEFVTRTGVRFINRLPVPGPSIDFDEILTAGPKIPPRLPQTLAHFSSNVILPIPDLKAIVSISQGMEVAPTSPTEARIDIILDIDAFTEEPLLVGDTNLWDTLEGLHNAKNMAFFGALTETALETYR